MTYFSNQLISSASRVLTEYINVRTETEKVPDVSDIALEKNQGVLIDGCYLYADMVDSSVLGQRIKKPVAAKIMRSYLNGASAVIRHNGGEIRSFDGDRVMGIFIGREKETKAVNAALGMNWLVESYLREQVSATWPDLKRDNIYNMRHCVGIDTGEALLTRTGIRGDNDIISIGPGPNVAAKLADLRDGYALHITNEVFEPMSNDVAYDRDNRLVWNKYWSAFDVGGRYRTVWGANAWREP